MATSDHVGPGTGARDTRVECSEEGCDMARLSRGLCSKHYARLRRNGHAGLQEKVPGPGSVMSNGYVQGWRDGHFVLMHRWVFEQKIGRPLRRGENVHHINGVRDDNRPENLELWVTSQPPGQRPEDLLSWAYEIIERYGP